MDSREQPLAPQWLRSNSNNSSWSGANHRRGQSLPQSEKDAYSNFRRNASRNRSYFSSGRSQHISDKRKYNNDVNHKRIFALGNHKYDPLDSVVPCRSEKDVLKQSHPPILHESGETWCRKVPAVFNNDKSNDSKNGHPVAGRPVDTVNKTLFEHEFPSLVSEDQQGACERGRQLSSGLSTIGQTFPVGDVAYSGNNGLDSTLVGTPVTGGGNSVAAALASSISSTSLVPMASSIIGRNMAETLAHVPPRLHTPELIVETQKLEELANKQSRQLVPMTPSTLRSPVVRPTEKSKVKISQKPQPFIRVANHSPRGGNAISDAPKTSLVNLSVLGASKEFGGCSSSAKSTSIPDKVTVVNDANCTAQLTSGPATLKKPNNLESTAQMMVERRSTFQMQSRNDFFKKLSRKNSTTCMSSNLLHSSANTLPPELENCSLQRITSSVTLNSAHDSSMDGSALNSTNESSSLTTSLANDCGISVEPSNQVEEISSTDSVLYPDEKEAAFLRSLGWEEDTEDDGGLTQEEINEFWDKITSLLKGLKQEEIVDYYNKHLHMKWRPSSEIFGKLFPRMILVPLNSNERSCNGASAQLSSSA